MDNPKNNRAPLLYYIKLCASFQIHQWIQTGVKVRKHPIWVKFDDFFSHVNLQVDVWPWKTIVHLFYATSSFVHHFVAISESKLELQSKMPNLGQIRQFLELCDLEIWRMTLKNNRAPPLCYLKLCASFRSHWWIQTAVTVWKITIWVKIDHFFSRVTLQFDIWPWKTTGHLFYAASSFVHHFLAIGEFKLDLQSGNAQFGSNSKIFRAVWPCNLTDDLEQGKSEGFESCDRHIVRKHPIWVKIGDVLSHVTLKFDGWPWKTIGQLIFAVSSFVEHFIAIGEFKLE